MCVLCVFLLSHTHKHTHTVCVGFLQTYLYGICILQTFIWLSGLGPRGASAAWGSVSQTHADGWARGACATLYWVSYDYPALSLSLFLPHTDTTERDCQRDREKESDGWREGKTDEGSSERKQGEGKKVGSSNGSSEGEVKDGGERRRCACLEGVIRGGSD